MDRIVTSTQERIAMADLRAQHRRLGGSVEEAMARVVEHGRFILGPEVNELEAELARRCGARHVVTCGSGTEALLMPLMAWGVGPGDTVFVPGFTFPATAEVVALLGATPMFVDVEAETFNLCPRSLEAAIASVRARGGRPAGVIPVDLFGLPAPYGLLADLVASEGMWMLADAAQSFGATLDGRPVGQFATATATSFFPAKPLGCYGDGGAICTDDDDLAECLRSIRAHGRGQHKYDIVRLGINGRLDTLQAAVVLAKLTIFDEELARRQELAARYSDALCDLVPVPLVPEQAVSAWAQYTILLDDRNAVAGALADAGVETAVYYPRTLPDQKAYAAHPVVPGGVPRAESLARRVLSIPFHPYLSCSDQDRVVDALRSVLGA